MLEEADTVVNGGSEVAIGGRDRGPGDDGDGRGGELEKLAEVGPIRVSSREGKWEITRIEEAV